MEYLFVFIILVTISLCLAVSEEPFCNNKCHNSGVTLKKVCSCDLMCASVFNDCCGDSEHLLNKYGRINFKRRTDMQCTKLANSQESVMTINKCSRDWKGPEAIKNSCNNPFISLADPLSSAPVTNILTGTTYRNYYCALCNGGMSNRVFWNVKVVCPTLDPELMEIRRQELFKYIYYNKILNKWGFSIQGDSENHEIFHICDISYVVPSMLNAKIRRCNSELVSTCLPTWKDDMIKRMCDRYVDPVYDKNSQIWYRNLYCSICNYRDISSISCGSAMGSRHNGMAGQGDSDRWNFALLVDINISDGNLVGKKDQGSCTTGEVYDPFADKCRNIVCGVPGMVLDNDKCVLVNS